MTLSRFPTDLQILTPCDQTAADNMLILHCTDLHGNRSWYNWLVKAAGHYDLVCVTGDHLDLSDFQSIDTQISMVRTTFEGLSSPLAVTSGNNDSFHAEGSPLWLFYGKWMLDLRRPGLWVDGDVIEPGGYRIRCVGWHARLPTALADEIWLYHAPPARSAVSVDHLGGDVGDEILGEICRAGAGPRILLSGHQHHPKRHACLVGRTWCMNPGQGTHPKVPNHVVINTLTRTAALHIDALHHSTINIS